MENVYIISFHCAHNFGAVLQCVALQKALLLSGIRVQVIDYQPRYLRRQYSPYRSIFFECTYDDFVYFKGSHGYYRYLLKHILINIRYNLSFINHVKKANNFSKFINVNLCMTRKCRRSKDLKEISINDKDIIICGSDQIWNKNLTGYRFDSAYFADFCNAKKIAYAISFGRGDIESLNEVKHFLKKFSYISFRESSVLMQVKDVIDLKIYNDCDPTLLLRREDYFQYERQVKIPENYILIYLLNKQMSMKALDLAHQFECEIINISPFNIKGCINYNFIGPGEFLFLIDHASRIITSSYHGTIFSILYKKNFVSLIYGQKDKRIIDLLNYFQIENVVHDYTDCCDNILAKAFINYDIVEKQLELVRMSYNNRIKTLLEGDQL